MLSTLVSVERQLGALRDHGAALGAVFGGGRVDAATAATAGTRQVLGSLATTLRSLRGQVLAIDRVRFGARFGSVDELVLRAVTIVVRCQLDELCARLLDAGPGPRTDALFVGRFGSIDDAAWFVHDELARIHDAQPADRAEVRAGLRAIAALGQDRDLAHLLREGAAWLDAPEIRAACEQLTIAFGLGLAHRP